MITPENIRREYHSATHAMLADGLAVDLVPQIVSRSGDVAFVTWATAKVNGVPLISQASLAEYERILRQRQYSALLFDNSVVQLSARFEAGKLQNIRLLYFPCPLPAERDGAAELALLDYLEMVNPAELRDSIILGGPLRFDFDESAQTEGHPASHLTLVRSSCRIPVFAPISGGQFLHFVVSHFYPDWKEGKAISGVARGFYNRSISEVERRQLHMECLRT